jgi:hypothetical protein
MEDLGHIDINIRELGGGGGGGGGSAGGGGSPGGGPRLPRIPQPPVIAPGAAQSLSGIEKVGKAGGVMDELSGFFSRPTASGFANLMSTSSATGEAMAGLGAAAGAAIPIIGAVVAAIAVGVLIFKALSAAAQKMAEVIQKLTRYSGELMQAVATERLREFQRQLDEAQENGKAYAMVQREATFAADATAAVTLQWNKVVAVGAIIFHRFTGVVMKMIYPITLLIGKLADMWLAVDSFSQSLIGDIQEGLRSLFDNYATPISEWLDGVWNDFRGMLGSFGDWLPTDIFSTLTGYVEKVLIYLGLIADNTKKTSGNAANDWFRADVIAMTGRKY